MGPSVNYISSNLPDIYNSLPATCINNNNTNTNADIANLNDENAMNDGDMNVSNDVVPTNYADCKLNKQYQDRMIAEASYVTQLTCALNLNQNLTINSCSKNLCKKKKFHRYFFLFCVTKTINLNTLPSSNN